MKNGEVLGAGELDANMKVEREILGDVAWGVPQGKPFVIAGFPWIVRDKTYRRLPLKTSEPLPQAVDIIANNVAGGTLSFKTDSSSIYVDVKLSSPAGQLFHMPASGEAGFDLYVGVPKEKRYLGTFMPTIGADFYTAQLNLLNPMREMREYTIYFPLYNGVENLKIGLDHDAKIVPPGPIKPGKIIVYGGSTIQGGCASRPGNACTNMISRKLNREVVNLGFSGNGKIEKILASVISDISDMAILLIEVERNTKYDGMVAKLDPFLDELRKHHPQLPVVLWSANPKANEYLEGGVERKQILALMRDTVKKRNDLNLYLFDSSNLLGDDWYECFVDGVHPNDLGFRRMANGITGFISDIIDAASNHDKPN